MRHPRQCTQPSQLPCLGCHGGETFSQAIRWEWRDSLLLLLLLVGVAVLVEALLSVRELDSLAAEEELQELSETAASGSDQLLASTTMHLCSLATRMRLNRARI